MATDATRSIEIGPARFDEYTLPSFSYQALFALQVSLEPGAGARGLGGTTYNADRPRDEPCQAAWKSQSGPETP